MGLESQRKEGKVLRRLIGLIAVGRGPGTSQSGSDYHVDEPTAFQRRCKATGLTGGEEFNRRAHVPLIP